jgi:hypothetical protein
MLLRASALPHWECVLLGCRARSHDARHTTSCKPHAPMQSIRHLQVALLLRGMSWRPLRRRCHDCHWTCRCWVRQSGNEHARHDCARGTVRTGFHMHWITWWWCVVVRAPASSSHGISCSGVRTCCTLSDVCAYVGFTDETTASSSTGVAWAAWLRPAQARLLISSQGM